MGHRIFLRDVRNSDPAALFERASAWLMQDKAEKRYLEIARSIVNSTRVPNEKTYFAVPLEVSAVVAAALHALAVVDEAEVLGRTARRRAGPGKGAP
jgi:hypothetical protein